MCISTKRNKRVSRQGSCTYHYVHLNKEEQAGLTARKLYISLCASQQRGTSGSHGKEAVHITMCISTKRNKRVSRQGSCTYHYVHLNKEEQADLTARKLYISLCASQQRGTSGSHGKEAVHITMCISTKRNKQVSRQGSCTYHYVHLNKEEQAGLTARKLYISLCASQQRGTSGSHGKEAVHITMCISTKRNKRISRQGSCTYHYVHLNKEEQAGLTARKLYISLCASQQRGTSGSHGKEAVHITMCISTKRNKRVSRQGSCTYHYVHLNKEEQAGLTARKLYISLCASQQRGTSGSHGKEAVHITMCISTKRNKQVSRQGSCTYHYVHLNKEEQAGLTARKLYISLCASQQRGTSGSHGKEAVHITMCISTKRNKRVSRQGSCTYHYVHLNKEEQAGLTARKLYIDMFNYDYMFPSLFWETSVELNCFTDARCVW